MKTKYLNLLVIFLVGLGSSTASRAQGKVEKLTEIFQVKKDISIEVDAKYTQLVFETWNQDKVEVTAFIDAAELSEDELNNALAQWNLQVMGNSNKVAIRSHGGQMGMAAANFKNLFNEHSFDFMKPLIENLVGKIDSMEFPQFPAGFMKNFENIDFDHEAYEKNGQAYLKKFEKQMEAHFGEDFKQSMEAWGQRFAQQMERQNKQREKKLKQLEMRLEERSAAYEKRMEKWSERMEQMAKRDSSLRFYKKIITSPQGNKAIYYSYQDSGTVIPSGTVKRIIKIKMPENARLNLNVRHGTVNLEENIKNLQANLSHVSLYAKAIGGENNRVQVSYSPVEINQWEAGSLSLSYVSNARIGRAEKLKLNANSSNVEIERIGKKGIISGTFGELIIAAVSNNFETLAINLENSNLDLKLPNSAFDFSFNGDHSKIDIPESLHVNSNKSDFNQFINGYYKSDSNTGSIHINAQFSEVNLVE